MRKLFPDEISEVSPRALISSEFTTPSATSSKRPQWVIANMVTSIDGATAVDGVSGTLGGEDDKTVFHSLRGLADVIIAGSATANAERYRLPQPPGTIEARGRASRGQQLLPRLCVMSRALRFDEDVPFLNHDLEDRELWPIIATTANADQAMKKALSERAEVLEAGEESVDPAILLESLVERGLPVSLCEGGPVVLAAFAERGLIDELNVTTAFALAGGESKRMLHGPSMFEEYRLDRLLLGDEAMFARYLRTPQG